MAEKKKRQTVKKTTETKAKTTKPKKAKKEVQKKTTKAKITKAAVFPIVGLGASAGGLEALELFFSNMPSDSNMAFVIIQHLSPNHKSIMASLLSKSTNMAVVEIENAMKIKPNCVYLNPPDKNVLIQHGTLQLMMPDRTDRINLPIDCFFRSMASDLGEKAICVILSGTATDGTLGLKTIKGEGGIAMVQDPASAKYDGMPRSAIATGIVDFVLPVNKLPGKLIKYIKAPYITETKEIINSGDNFSEYIQTIFALIRKSTGHDLSHYKQTTISRRIERRMAVHQIAKIGDYVKFLGNNTAETDILFKDMLIGVTNFFRDAEAFVILKEQVLPGLLKNREPDSLIRIWIVGCSTGEEAYSLAILFLEVMVLVKQHYNIQVFASDIDADAIERARLGVYPESIAADVSKERLNKYFIKEDNTYRVKKQIREMIIFAVQNVIKDPPFSKIDLLSCRNLLIYMDAPLQKKVMPLFHYTLKSDGVMLLGTSESIGEFTDLFSPFNNKWKIFKKQKGYIEKAMDYPITPFYQMKAIDAIGDKAEINIDVQSIAERVILDDYAPPGVLVNEHYEIIHSLGKTDKYLAIPTGKATLNVLSMAREGLRLKLSSALNDVKRHKKICLVEGVRVKYNGDFHVIDLTVRPLPETGTPSEMLLVMFDEQKQISKPVQDKKEKSQKNDYDPAISTLEQELNATKEHLKITIEELETSNEELKSTNEELQSVNEELQSANEELETSKEELQSTNEELVTVNTELQNNVDELSVTNNDINNLLASTDIGTIFLDIELKIKRFTPAMTKIFNLIVTDVGRSITDITANILIEDFHDDLLYVLKTLQKKIKEVQNKEGRWYSIQMIPYRTVDNVIDGVVITFTNITHIKKTEKMQRRLATIVRDSNDAITIQDFDGNIIAWNKGAQKMYGYSEDEAIQMNIRDIVPKDKSEEALAFVKQLQEEEEKEEEVESFETFRLTKDGRTLDVWLTVTKLADDMGKTIAIATTERNVTERKRSEENLRRLATVVIDSNDAITIQDYDGKITAWNKGATGMYGYTEAEALKMNIQDIVPVSKKVEALAFVKKLQKEDVKSFKTERLTKEGKVVEVWLTVTKLTDDQGKPISIATTERDISDIAKLYSRN